MRILKEPTTWHRTGQASGQDENSGLGCCWLQLLTQSSGFQQGQEEKVHKPFSLCVLGL